MKTGSVRANQTMLDLNHPYSTTQEWVGNAKQSHSQTGIWQCGPRCALAEKDCPDILSCLNCPDVEIAARDPLCKLFGNSGNAGHVQIHMEREINNVRVLVGTRKGAFILTSDGKRARWDISGPHFAGWDIYHLKGSPADPNRLYASQCSGWFGQLIQRSNDGGKTWVPVGNKFVYEGVPGTHQWYDGTPHPWEFKRVWHLEPSLTDPDTVYAGVEDAALFRSTDGGQTWQELPGLRGHGSGSRWQPGAGGMCLHTILLDPSDPRRIFIAISAAGAFRTDDAGQTWRPELTGILYQVDS